ncbi:DUF4105 domain-containing protein [Luteimonas suaedae]|uniref:DUF7844 domain-containing protein n=1 Tax=Luteimonas suaedae TaxID=2605430 RepID=UPI00210627D6|nr:DUF4105 domain-containing protein [Luteimonas suaedae]
MIRRLRRPWSPWWPVLCLLAGTAPAQALSLQIEDGALHPVQAAATRQLLDTTIERLPPAWAAALDHRVVVEWRDDLPAQVHGRAIGRRMLLDRALLDRWMARPADAGSDDPATRAAQAAVLHELAHFYDRSPHGGLSHDPRLLDLAGWQVSPLRLGLRVGHNAFSDRSPDRYELTSPAEFVAVNLEHFLLDPDYGCRRPALYRYFAAHFGTSPPQAECAPDLVYLQVDGDAPQPLLQIDPARVYAVDYLLAEGNERLMSRWGHSMLRLVICAPDRPRGPDCRLDLDHHRVLSFRAFVDDVQVSSWRGLTGSYPSRLFVLPLAQVIDEYTKVELRGLQSIPLRLQDAEIAALLERAARLHWSYDGRYYFLGNNCAVETFKLLHDGVPRLAGERLASITPTALLRRLRRAGIAETGVLEDRDEARRLGYYFEPLSARYQAMFEVARQALDLPQARVQDWLDLAPAGRTPVLRRGDLRASAALLLLEQAALRRQELLARDELKRRLLGGAAQDPDALAAVQDFLGLQALLSRPATLLPETGYGLPQQEERDALARLGERHAAQWRQQGERLRAEARRWLPPQSEAALEATEANVDLLAARQRELHREQGGLQL